MEKDSHIKEPKFVQTLFIISILAIAISILSLIYFNFQKSVEIDVLKELWTKEDYYIAKIMEATKRKHKYGDIMFDCAKKYPNDPDCVKTYHDLASKEHDSIQHYYRQLNLLR